MTTQKNQAFFLRIQYQFSIALQDSLNAQYLSFLCQLEIVWSEICLSSASSG